MMRLQTVSVSLPERQVVEAVVLALRRVNGGVCHVLSV